MRKRQDRLARSRKNTQVLFELSRIEDIEFAANTIKNCW